MTVINGDFERVGGKPRKRRKQRARAEKGLHPAGGLHRVGSIGTDFWEWMNPDLVQQENVMLTGMNYVPDDNDAGALNSLGERYNAALAQLDDASTRLDAAESNLLAIQSEVFTTGNAQQQAEWTAKYNNVIAAQTTRDTALSAVSTVGGWISSARQAIGLGRVGGMGLLPAVPWSLVAGIAAAAAAIYAIANAANAFFNQWEVAKWNAENIRRQQAGEPPLEGGPALTDTGGGISGIFGDTATIVKYAAIGLIAFFVLPPMLRALESR